MDPKGTPKAGWTIVLALALFLGGAALAVRDLSTSNRPHELTAAPYVTVLFAISATLAVRCWIHMARSKPAVGGRPLMTRVLQVFLGLFIVVNLLLLVSAAGTGWTVLTS
jgi:hypothetical protein|tara:strand:+ start:166 stop:495 length:330 start_codon:yes stop_codon:yes gene_type:complete